MSKCPNCGTAITCGCQKRTLANGRIGCSRCVGLSTKDTSPALTPVVNQAILKNKE